MIQSNLHSICPNGFRGDFKIMFITGLILCSSKSSKYKQILEQLEIYIYKTHLFLLTEENKTLHLCDTHVSVSLSVYVTLQIFSYLSIYLYINIYRLIEVLSYK